MNEKRKAFMQQFDLARKEVANVPEWLKESAKVATLTYPSVKTTSVAVGVQSSQAKKKAVG